MMVSLLFSRRYWPVSKGYDRVDSEMVLPSTYCEAFRLIVISIVAIACLKTSICPFEVWRRISWGLYPSTVPVTGWLPEIRRMMTFLPLS